MKTGIVLEGGAFRGLFTAGALDCLMDNQIVFDYVVGVSAGAGNAVNYLAGQKVVPNGRLPQAVKMHIMVSSRCVKARRCLI